VSIEDASSLEGSGNLEFLVTLSSPMFEAVTLDYSSANGSATAGADYQSTFGELTFLEGKTSQLISVPIVNDSLDENDESLTITLSNLSTGTFTDNIADGVIQDDDNPPTLFVKDIMLNETDGNAVFSLLLGGLSAKNISVETALINGSAQSGNDFGAISTSDVTIPAGQQSAIVTVPIVQDNRVEFVEQFTLRLSQPQNVTLPDNEAVARIIDQDEATIALSGGVPIEEGDEGSTLMSFEVTLNQGVSGGFTLDYVTNDVTAEVADGDYVLAAGTLTFSGVAGETKTIEVEVLGDEIVEPNESFVFALNEIEGTTLSERIAIEQTELEGHIINDEGVVFLFESNEIIVGEAQETIEVVIKLSNPSADSVSVSYRSSAVSALANEDYEPVDGILEFEPGQLLSSIQISILPDDIYELDETFNLILENGSEGTTVNSIPSVITLENDDLAPAFVFSEPDYSVSEADGFLNLSVQLSAASAVSATVDIVSQNGSAAFGSDYAAVNETLLFLPGETSKTVPVQIVQDSVYETIEDFKLSLFNPVHGRLLEQNEVEVDILDGLPPPTVSIDNIQVEESDAGEMLVSVLVNISAPSATDTIIHYATRDGSAMAGEDYEATSGSVLIPAGAMSESFLIKLYGDLDGEPDEFFEVVLSLPIDSVLNSLTASRSF
ncbi:MAG: Calx-beta domain-containing protein, partial [Chloroflexota bacterium]